MKKFDIYVLKIYFKYLIIVQLFIMVVATFVSALAHLESFKSYGITLPQLLKLELITLPMSINSVLPITTVVASIVTVLLLMRSRELLAYVSLGGRIQRFLAPFIAASVLTSLFMFYFDYNIQAKARVKQQKYLLEDIKKRVFYDQGQLSNFWIMDENMNLMNIGLLDPINNYAQNIKQYVLDDDFKISTVINIENGRYYDNLWHFNNTKIADLTVTPPKIFEIATSSRESQFLNELTSISGRHPKEISPKELSRTIKAMKKSGLSTVQYEMILYEKYANALSVIVLVILVVPMGINFSRRYSPIKSATVSFIFGISFWGVMAAFISLGSSAIINPKIACFAPHAIFLILGITLLKLRERVH